MPMMSEGHLKERSALKFIIIMSIFFLGVILPLSNVSAQKRSYFGVDVEPWALSSKPFDNYPRNGWSLGVQYGQFYTEHAFWEMEARTGEYDAEGEQPKSMFAEVPRYRAIFTSLGLKVGVGSSYLSNFRIYYFAAADLYVFGSLHDVYVSYNGINIPGELLPNRKFPSSCLISINPIGLKIMVPISSVEAVLTLKAPNILPYIGLFIPVRQKWDDMKEWPPDNFSLLSFGVQF